MQDFEKLGVFYLGRTHDIDANKTRNDLVLYDAKDLTTHAVCVGMTGSGKTGLCLALLEEAAIDGIPVIAIDPKGDLGNLLLTFPDLRPADFKPWVEEAEAARQGLSTDEYAERVATTWREGLAEWDQDPARIARFKNAVDVSIYTPGSTSGLPLTVLKSFAAPPPSVLEDADAMRERIVASASGLLGLLGIDADPIRSREHILVSNLLDHAWRAGRGIDIAGLIRDIQRPPFEKIGVIDLETFFPQGDRFALAMQLNNLLASPTFQSWTEGEALDIKRLLYTPEGKPRLSIISIAHLSDSERMFFVTILLNEILAWTRSQAGTSSLRAIIYMDEVFGYFPPTANPPSKIPMLTLLKQARAFGVGIVLATQNPVDLDYKGLSNAGTWFLGRLQTERDKARVLDGLEGASAESGSKFDRGRMERILSGLGNRVFLMNNVHEDEPVVFKSRWALSYLRGPMTRSQIQTLMRDKKAALPAAKATTKFAPAAGAEAVAADSVDKGALAEAELPAAAASAVSVDRPVTPPESDESFVPVGSASNSSSSGSSGRSSSRSTGRVYRPALLGIAKLHFVKANVGVDHWSTHVLLRMAGDDALDNPWDSAEVAEEAPELARSPEPNIGFAALPAPLARAANYARWSKSLKDYLYREQSLTIWSASDLDAHSEPGETEGDFRVRLRHLAKENRDRAVEKLRQQYAPKFRTIDEQMRRAQERVDKEKAEFRSSQLDAAISFGTSILGAVFGRKLGSRTNVGSAGSAIRSASRSMRQKGDVGRAEETVESVAQRKADLEAELQEKVNALEATINADDCRLEEVEIRPRKTDVAVERLSLIWIPE